VFYYNNDDDLCLIGWACASCRACDLLRATIQKSQLGLAPSLFLSDMPFPTVSLFATYKFV